MGFLRVREIKKCRYFYWSTRTRSSKKYGGSGKVRSSELLIGNRLIGKYLPFYFWAGEIPVRDYADAMIAFSCPEGWHHRITVAIDWSAKPRVTLKSVPKAQGYQPDCRSAFWRKQKRVLQERLDAIIDCSGQIAKDLEWAACFLSRHDDWIKAASQERAKAADIRKDPYKVWTEFESVKDPFTGCYHQKEVEYSWKKNADFLFDEDAADSESEADLCDKKYQENLDFAVKLAPLRRQKEFQTLALRQIQKLASDSRWADLFEISLLD